MALSIVRCACGVARGCALADLNPLLVTIGYVIVVENSIGGRLKAGLALPPARVCVSVCCSRSLHQCVAMVRCKKEFVNKKRSVFDATCLTILHLAYGTVSFESLPILLASLPINFAFLQV